MKAYVIFDSRYGNTERIARALKTGLEKAGVETVCARAKDADLGSLQLYDLICLGAPTEAFSASQPMKRLLESLKGAGPFGSYCFAFDTKANPGIFGSAAKFIEKDLKKLGLQVIAPRESAIVFTDGKTSSARLKEGEIERFEQIGLRVGTVLAARGRTIEA